MDNDDAIIGKVFTRREALRATAWAGLSVMAAGVFAPVARAGVKPRLPLVASPEMTEGPFFVDEKLNRADLVTGATRPGVINGLPLAIAFSVYKLEKGSYAPMPGVQIDVWHADASGAYSDESNPMNHEDTARQTWLRGFQRTDAAGEASFRTIFPGWYQGRAPHVHFKVRRSDAAGKLMTADFSSQLFFKNADADRIYAQAPYNATRGERDTRNEDDGIYNAKRSDGTVVGTEMLLDLAAAAGARGYTAQFPVLLTDGSFRSGHHGGPGGPGGPGGFRGPPPGGDWDRPPRDDWGR